MPEFARVYGTVFAQTLSLQLYYMFNIVYEVRSINVNSPVAAGNKSQVRTAEIILMVAVHCWVIRSL